jgi:hypothetical protein
MTYGSEREFPWTLDAIQMPAINFYKIIEMVVRADSELSRDMVRDFVERSIFTVSQF